MGKRVGLVSTQVQRKTVAYCTQGFRKITWGLESADDLSSLTFCCRGWVQAPATGKQHHLVLGGSAASMAMKD